MPTAEEPTRCLLRTLQVLCQLRAEKRCRAPAVRRLARVHGAKRTRCAASAPRRAALSGRVQQGLRHHRVLLLGFSLSNQRAQVPAWES